MPRISAVGQGKRRKGIIKGDQKRGRVAESDKEAAESSVSSTLRQTYVIKPEMRNAVDNLMRGRDEVHGHDESDALTECGPVVITPYCFLNAPLAFACYHLLAPDVAQQHPRRGRR